MARIVVLNYCDLEVTRAEVAAGTTPAHHLYGTDHLERRGHEVTAVPYVSSPLLQRATRALRRSPLPLGDLDQQRSVLRAARNADLVYAPTQIVAQSLGYLRALGAFDTPLVCLIHHPLDRGRLSRWRRPAMRTLLRGIDAYPAFSSRVAEELAELGGAPERATAVSWGPDADFYPHGGELGRGVVSAGRTNRDHDTFAAAAALTDVPTSIVCPVAREPSVPTGPNTVFPNRGRGEELSYPELVELYAGARAIAIPLRVAWPWPVNGLASLMDALGMGKPVILTRHPWIDLDVERLGIGIHVDPGDVDGWRAAIDLLDERPELAREMGARARALVDGGEYTSEAFGAQIAAVIERVLGDG